MLSHLEFEQIKRALERMRGKDQYNTEVKREDVVDILMPYVEGFTPPNPHPVTGPVPDPIKV